VEHEFSIVIPVLNESGRINSLVEGVLSFAGGESFEVIVVDGGADGGTVGSIGDVGSAGDVAVKTLVSERGRGRQMNAAAKIAKGDVLVFLHADTQLPDGAFANISRVLEDGKYVGGAFDLGVDTNNIILKAIVAVSRFRNRLTRMPYGDQAFFIRRDYFESLGGFAEIALMEDVELMRRIKRRGDKICILRDRVKTSARRWEKEGIVYGTIRNIILVNLFYLGVDPDKLARYYKS
jgi:rSAM/selenodomain-associated transferase 2